MECVIRLLWDCMYGVEKTAVEWRLENCDKVNKYLNTSPLDWLNFEDQRTFFKLAKEAFEFDFESEEEFTFCASPPFNTLSTNKLKEIVLKAKTTFKWQSSKEGQLRREDSLKDWMFSRPLALRPIYWEISSDAYTYFKMEYESELKTEIFGVRRFQILD
mmetsp:Transcript_24390/g.35718  ORF Transcript_24390/g.35718 Transcript_24390/m.35718 type:complete len:160 (-) Transcript_24390:127-606(-)